MKIAIASGKGGTGKTTVATNLAVALKRRGRRVHLLDCDVEEPNCHLFLEPRIQGGENVTIPVPRIIGDRCTGCGKCAQVCRFNAITVVGRKALAFTELCHGCGGCWLVCPEEAVVPEKREIGRVEWGESDGLDFTMGRLRVGEPMAPPLIVAVRKRIREGEITILDAPPGTSCPMITAVRECDFVCLVTEPTPFGLNDLQLAVETVRKLKLPLAVIVNKAGVGETEELKAYCRGHRLNILLEIPHDPSIARLYSNGELVSGAVDGLEKRFAGLVELIEKELG